MSKSPRILVLSEDYSNNEGKVSLHYIHTRNIEYLKSGIQVDVLSFSTSQDYNYEGIRVISEETYSTESVQYSKLLSHAPNLKNHYRFINKNTSDFEEIIMFFHGHEVLKISEAYPEPYSFVTKRNKFKVWLRDRYDDYKFRKWKNFIINHKNKLELVFVSDWMLNQFLKNIKISKDDLSNYHIIHNSVGAYFEKNSYDSKSEKKYDFVTIRSSLDGSKYCIDVVRKLALKYPNKCFLVIGKGKFFEHYEQPENLTLIQKQLNHQEIIHYLNRSRFALLPTRTDSQGVMACEMLTFGIPLVTSNIPVCEEMFQSFSNVIFIDNELPVLDFSKEFWQSAINAEKIHKFSRVNTVDKEIELIIRERK